MDQNPGGSSNTGTRDSTYDLVAVLYHALQGVENCQTYLGDAGDEPQLRQFFEQAQQMQRQLAEQAKTLLHDQLMNKERAGGGEGSSGGSAFSQFGASGGASSAGAQSASGDQQRMGSFNDREGGSAYTSGQSPGAQQNDPSMGQFGQSPMGGGQRHNEMSTGGGGTSSF